MAGADRPGALVVSLDFELTWGVRDRTEGGYARNLYGSRVAIPRLLSLFEDYAIAATWATVGFLFARTREEITAMSPPAAARPAYADPALDPYVEVLGRDEEDDPLHYAPSLIDAIGRTPRQEIATHTFSHYYTRAAGQGAEAFRADLGAARAIAARHGIEFTSIVFPRNQHNPAYDPILLQAGITAYRGTPHSWTWSSAGREEGSGPGVRAARLLDSYAGPGGHGTYAWSEVLQPSGLSDVRASRFLRPATPRLPGLDALRQRRIRGGLRAAARRGEIFHLWWHPHNHGRDLEENLAGLRAILDEFAHLRDAQGMRSLSMAGVDAVVRGTDPDGIAPAVRSGSHRHRDIPTEEACE